MKWTRIDKSICEIRETREVVKETEHTIWFENGNLSRKTSEYDMWVPESKAKDAFIRIIEQKIGSYKEEMENIKKRISELAEKRSALL